MKKYIFFFLALQLSIKNFSQTPTAGQLKITIESFKCINQSWDGLVEFDGHGNEVFINYGYRVYSPSATGSAKPGAGFTPVFGSGINGQIKVGTASALGGIANGNEIIVNTLVLNEHVDAGNLILFSPSVWEWDNSNNDRLNLFNQQLATDLNWLMAQPYPFLNATINYNDPYNGRFIKIGDRYSSYWPVLKYNNILKPLINVQDNRPVGVEAGPFNGENFALYNPAILILDTKVLMAVYTRNKNVRENAYGTTHPERPRSISEVVEMGFTENTYAIVTSNGSYSLKLKIEFTPDATSTSPLTGTPTRPITTIKKDMPVKNMNINNSFLPVIGNWSGTQTNDYGLYPQNIAFQLTANGEYLIKDMNGVVAAKGAYTFSNNALSGSYKQLSSGETFSFTATFDPATQKISATLGSGSAITGQGKWTVTKK